MTVKTTGLTFDATGRPLHERAYRIRRFLNWFPLGVTYALLYMGRYNLTVAKNSLGTLMTKEDFGLIFGAGTIVYAFAFLLNGPMTDRMGGRRAILLASFGSMTMNVLMGLFVQHRLTSDTSSPLDMTLWMSLLYAVNMYFQSFAAVAVIKVNAHWFHVRERGGFSGIFGTMISSGLFLAFSVNGWILDLAKKSGTGQTNPVWWVFFAPAVLIGGAWLFELIVLRDRPGLSGWNDFDTGDESGDDTTQLSTVDIIKRVLTHPVILVVALVEFCTGVLRNGVMHWFPIYAKEVWVLPGNHALVYGEWSSWQIVVGFIGLGVGLTLAGIGGRARNLGLFVAIISLIPFVPAGWGGFLFAAGVFGSNTAGWVSDIFFQSRRAPAAGGLYAVLAVACLVMVFALGGTTTQVAWVKKGKTPLLEGDRIVEVAGNRKLDAWPDITRAYACVPATCPANAGWDESQCKCTSAAKGRIPSSPVSPGAITIVVLRNGAEVVLEQPDPDKVLAVGDTRSLPAGPVLPLSPIWLAVIVFIISFAVIGVHGLLSGTATMDFGGRKGAATATGMIDGFVYLGTGLQSLCLGFLTTKDWLFWPLFLAPFALAGFILCTRIWHAKPGRKGGGH